MSKTPFEVYLVRYGLKTSFPKCFPPARIKLLSVSVVKSISATSFNSILPLVPKVEIILPLKGSYFFTLEYKLFEVG